jgi:hypothetical protein
MAVIEYVTTVEPGEWGPLMWRLLHVAAEKLGRTGNAVLDADAATYISYIMSHLPDILPCPDCRTHARTYLFEHKFDVRGKTGPVLQSYVRIYLFLFHNAVRARKGQSIMFATVDDCADYYYGMTFNTEDERLLADVYKAALAQRLVRSDHYKQWMGILRRLRLLVGF